MTDVVNVNDFCSACFASGRRNNDPILFHSFHRTHHIFTHCCDDTFFADIMPALVKPWKGILLKAYCVIINSPLWKTYFLQSG